MLSVFSPPAAQPMVRGSRGALYAPSSFGIADTTFGPTFRPLEMLESERAKLITYAGSFYSCTQHDHKVFDFNGRYVRAGLPVQGVPLIGASMPSFYVPLDQRRPSSPYRLAYTIVERFTSLVFGEARFPKVVAEGDEDTTDFVEALVEAQQLQSVMVRARSQGGARGTVGLSWRFFEGRPIASVHLAQNLWVHEWLDFERCIPEHVTEIVPVLRDVIDHRTGKMVRKTFWQRRDWTPLADVVFVEVEASSDEVHWVVDEEKTVVHGDGEAHFVWIQNLPDDDEATKIDGRPDYDNLFENLNHLDILNSVVGRGGVLNLDPTLVLKVDPEIAKRGVRKGSDNALTVGKDGDANYLELAGSSLSAGNELIRRERSQVLEVAQCVIPDPDEAIAAGVSSLVIRLMYLPMTTKCDTLRTQYGGGIVRLLEQQLRSARRLLPEELDGQVVYPVETVVDEETGVEVERPVEYSLDLPPKVVEEDEIDEAGQPTGKKRVSVRTRRPGKSKRLKLVWPPYFPPTEQERQQQGQTLGTATGGKAMLSQQTAVERWAIANGLDPAVEWKRVREEQKAAAAAQAEAQSGMWPGIGGGVDAPAPAKAPTEEAKPELADRDDDALPEPEPQLLVGGGSPAGDEPAAAVPPPAQVEQVDPGFMPNGSQVSAAVAIVEKVVAGSIPRDAGLGLLQVMFNLTPDVASQLMGSAGLAPAQQLSSPEQPPP